MNTELILTRPGKPPQVTAYSRTITREGTEFRLTYHSEYGFGLQARIEYDYEDWVDVELVQDREELAEAIAKILCIGFDYRPCKIRFVQIGWMIDDESGRMYPLKDFGNFGELEFHVYGGEHLDD